MTVKCIRKSDIGTEEGQITVGNTYLVLEIIFSHKRKLTCSYRILNNSGIPCIYPAECFEIQSNRLDDMVITESSSGIIITHERIATAFCENMNGFWAGFFESDNFDVHNLARKVVEDLNRCAKLDIPDITAV